MLRTKATASAPMWTVPVLILLVSHNFDPAVAFTFTFDPPTRKTGLVRCSSFVRRIRTTSLGSAPSLGGGRGEWDNDDFLSSLSSTPQGGSNENEESSPPSGKGKGEGDDQVGSGSERFRRMKEIAESGVPPPRPPPKLSAPPPPPPPPPQAEQAEAGAAASTAVPPPPPPPGYGPPGYYPPPPGYGYPPPPPPSGAEGQPATAGVAEGQAAAATPPPTGYYPPPPPPGYDPSNPPPPGYMPGYYPPQGYYPPPPGYDYYAQQQTQQPHDPENPPPSQPQYYPPPPPPQAQSQAPAKTTRDDTGRRRRPEDKIANTSDLYLEQLKIDSTSRTRARLRGDEETANRAWVDPQIRAVKEQLDPILSSETRKSSEKGVDSGGLYATSRDEMLIFRDGDAKVDKSDTGVSYRQRMADKMKGKKKSAGKTAVESPKAAIPAPEQPATVDIVDESPKAAVESIAEAEIIKPESTVPSPPSLPEPTELEDQPATVVGGEQQRQAPLPPPMSSDQETSVPLTPAPVTAAEEDARRQIRALMGLLLKHRGGPGFGAGRLKNPAEIRRFDETLCEVMDLLGEEAGVDVEVAPAAVPSPPAASATGGASGGGPALSGALACVKGAVQMYEGAAAGRERDDLLGPLRDALRHAVDVCTAAIDAGDAGGSDKGEFDFPKAGNYNVDMSVPAAAAAASPSAEAVKTEDGASSRGTTPPTATLETSAGKDVRASVVGGDGSDNEEVLRKAYRELKEARGDGKYGLDPSITGLEAGELADSLLDMRRVLMSELDIGGVVSGGGDSSPSAEVVAAGETKSKSNYQDMLAKAKAAKAAKKAGAGGT